MLSLTFRILSATLQFITTKLVQAMWGFLCFQWHYRRSACTSGIANIRMQTEKTPNKTWECASDPELHELILKERKWANIRNQYNQAPHLTQDAIGKVTSDRHHKREPRGQPFPSRWPQGIDKQTRTKSFLQKLCPLSLCPGQKPPHVVSWTKTVSSILG